MRGLSLLQPWATLVAIGAKRWETRSFRTHYRGPIAIHASACYPRECRELEAMLPFSDALQMEAGALPRGAILAVGEITGCLPAEEWLVSPHWSAREQDFGAYAARRFAWQIENIRKLRTPVPCKGALGLWKITPELIARIAQ